jgi:hypothetical protein
MTKKQMARFQKILEQAASATGTSVEAIKEEHGVGALQSREEEVYERQAVYNFFKARIEPTLPQKIGRNYTAKELEEFDKAFREWRIRTCEECGEDFAYAFSYDGVKFCSLDCLDGALRKIGLQVTRGRDLKKRWGVFHHPAIVPSSALATLKTLYNDSSPDAFSPSATSLPKPQTTQDAEKQMSDIQS